MAKALEDLFDVICWIATSSSGTRVKFKVTCLGRKDRRSDARPIRCLRRPRSCAARHRGPVRM